MDVPIKVIKDFIPQSDIDYIINTIDTLEKNNFDSFATDESGLRLALQIGNDSYHPESHRSLGADFSLFPENGKLYKNYFKKVIDSVKSTFTVEEDLHMCSFWLGKQYPGATVPIHDDTDSGFSPQNKYSGIIYLNSMENGGDLSFVKFNYSYKPEAGSLVIFPSREGGLHGVSRIDEIRYSLLFWMTFDKSRSLV
jgi:hypothetical protein